MMQKLWCHHGHIFRAPHEARRYVVCPLCGVLTACRQTDVDTRGQEGPHEQTLHPGISPPEVGRGKGHHTIALPPDSDSGDRMLPTGTYQGLPPGVAQGDPGPPHSVPPADQLASAPPQQDGGNGSKPAECPTSGGEATADGEQDGNLHTIGDSRPSDDVEPGDTPEGGSRETPTRTPDPHVSSKAMTVAVRETLPIAPAPPVNAAAAPPTEPGRITIPRTVPIPLRGDGTPGGSGPGTAAPTTSPQLDDNLRAGGPPNLPGYRVVEEVGRGGMGIVYRAVQEGRNRDVALKTLLRISPVELQRFKQEFRSLADIAHPNLAVLYELLSDGRTWCFSMEMLEAVDFTEFVWSGYKAIQEKDNLHLVGEPPNGQPRLTSAVQERLFEGLRQLVLGLHALHQAGMLHRDIKPSNVLVTTDGRVVLVDFGLASQFEQGSAEKPVGIHGTPEYMAPEQAACNPVSPASDWYALGVMLYEILTGRFPIAGERLKIIVNKQSEIPRAPQEYEPGIPDDLNALCVALLDLDPEQRPTAVDVLRCIGADDSIAALAETDPVGSGRPLTLVGREVHLQSLRTSFKQVIAGRTKTIFVHGKSGMGKSVLLQKFLAGLLEDEQAVVLSGRCYEQESVPFKALDSLIDSLADYLMGLPAEEVKAATPHDLLPLIRLFSVLGQIPGASDPGRPSIKNVDQQELRQRAMNALRELLKRLGDRKPVVLHIDDLQWGDEDSADLLADLVRPPNAPRVLVLGAYRSENWDTSLCLKALETAYTTGRRPHREKMAVDSLQEQDARRLALMLLGRDDRQGHALAAKIARESGGSPFFVWELAQHVQDSSNIADQSLELDEVIWARVKRLPQATRRLLELVAVIGRPIPAVEAYQAIDAVQQGQGFLAQLRTRHFVRTTEDEDETIVEAYHDRIRESVVAHLDADTIKDNNLRMAETIDDVSGIQADDLWAHINATGDDEEPGAPYSLGKPQWQRVFDLAYFYDAGGQPGRAFPFALCAAEQARQQDAQEVAEQQFRIALRGVQNMSRGLHLRVCEGLGDVLVLRGRYEEANEQYHAAAALTQRRVTLARLDAKLGRAAFKKGDMGDARDYQKKALAALGERLPGNALTLTCGLVKESLIQVLHTNFPTRFVGRRTMSSPHAPMDLFRAGLLDHFTLTNWFTQPMPMVLWSHLRGMNVAERYPPSQELGQTYAFHAITMTGIPMAGRGIAYAKKAHQISLDNGDLWGQGKARAYHTFSCIVLARFNEGVRTGSEAVRLLEEAGDVWEANMARMISTVPMFHLGDLKSAYRVAKKAYEIGMETGDYSAACISLLFWVPAAPDLVPPGAIQTELERARIDPLAITGAVYARGLELLLCEDKPLEAATVLQDCLARAKSRGLRNVCVFSAATWKATALRIAAERATDGLARKRLLKQARKAIRTALSLTRRYRACRPHAFREAGILAAMEGRAAQARRYFDESLQVATDHEARYDHALTSLARGQAGLEFGWTGAEREVHRATRAVAEIEDVEAD